ncbi:methyl-accepting chemotaxis protein [Sulfitobacter sp. D35]|uniref:methyl-accepting chemotaxis protein n=1 Tax=Sulfitobacter sp. D35 TaxID=3083252 RepID=UPI00296EDF6A|nr:methyl-accepting chemotaxis protein [Sulfitobacter sp. D35]MDW4496637.1 methyl-accepting chemotaxis protein [Sulfitobacter sp. D35]
MASDNAKRGNPFNSLFFRCTSMVVLCIVAVVAAIVTVESQSLYKMVHAATVGRAAEVTELLGKQVGEDVRYQRLEELDRVVGGEVRHARPDAVSGLVMSAAGTVLSTETPDGSVPEDLIDLAREAIATDETVLSPDGLTIATPVHFGDDGAVVGVVATQWTEEPQLAEQKDVRNHVLMLAFGITTAAALASGLFLRFYMSQPLLRLEAAMGRVAGGDFDFDVPFTTRKDEIGLMAQRLDRFRIALGEAKAAERESAFKGAAFSGSTAPMMMADEELNVIFANPACEGLLKSCARSLSQVWPGIDANNPVGAELAQFKPLAGLAAELRAGSTASLPATFRIQVGEMFVGIGVSAARDEAGQGIGVVVELSDRTEEQLNAALLDSIDQNQLKIEFQGDGTVSQANGNLRQLAGYAETSLGRMRIDTMLKAVDSAGGKNFSAAALAGEAVHGRFRLVHADGKTELVVEGGFTTVKGPNGNVERVIFLGTDATANAEAMRQAEAERKATAESQRSVVESLGASLTRLAQGDLTCGIESAFPQDYETLRANFNDALTSLREALGTVVKNAESIRRESDEITSAADDLSRRTEKQAATLEETAAALDELTTSVRSAAEGADEASSMSANAKVNAEDGGAVARDAVKAMDEIRSSSLEISKITTVIDDIAFQTNLLALNAGVEAARAGEAGRGFAVVATEVRALAQRSSEAAREINTLISNSSDHVQHGVDLVDRTGKALDAIVTSVSEISNRMSAIAASSREQSAGLNEINSAMNDLDHVTQQNAAMFEETTAASHALISEADALAGAVARFTIGETGGAPATPARRHASPPAGPAAKPVRAAQGNAALKIEEAPPARDGWEDF